MKILPLLRQLGLSDNESLIYITLLEQGQANVSLLAKRSGLYRPQIYKLLPELDKKHLIAQQKIGRRTLYLAENPIQLKALINRMSDDLEAVADDLFQTYRSSKHRPVIYNFEGKEGIKRVYEEMMSICKKGDVIYRYESPSDFKKIKEYYPKLYLAKATGQVESLIEKFVITNEKTHNARCKRLERYSKFIPANIDPFEYDITLLIYHNRVVFIDYKREAANIIESKRYAEFQRQLFKLLFNTL
jgi:sugar-specific transcriptional regulator TrmB